MAQPNLPDDLPVLGFEDADAFGRWLAEQHATSAGLWLQIPKKAGGGRGPSYTEALDHALCFGWIDSQKRKLDEVYFLQRFTPRTSRSRWSKVNCRKVEALVAAGRMREAGLVEVRAAQADGRWEAAYDPPSTAVVPEDLAAALDATPGARAGFEALSGRDRFVALHDVQAAKRAETRARRIAKVVARCVERAAGA